MRRITIKKYRQALSSKESEILSELSYNNKSIFTLEDLKGMTEYRRSFVDHLIRKKWVLPIRRGTYLITPLEAGKEGSSSYTVHSFVVASFLTKPYYIGYWSALNYYGFTEQTPPCVYVTTTIPKNSKKILDTEFKFVTITSRKMFDTEAVMIEKWPVNISSPEKTFVDCLDHPEHAGGIEEVAKSLYFSSDEIKLKKMAQLATKMGNSTVVKRLGYLSEVLGLEDCLGVLSKAKIKKGYSMLDTLYPKKGRIKERWSLFVNVTIDPKRWEK